MEKMSLRTKIILWIYFILGLPALPLALLMFIIRRFVFEETKIFALENRLQLISDCCTYMITFTIFAAALIIFNHYHS